MGTAQHLASDLSRAIVDLYERSVDPISRWCWFPMRLSNAEVSAPPSVLLLGNHSSGKSSMINYLLGSPVQRTGLAPTDDGFTILTHGDADEDVEGHAVVSNPDLPYGALRPFGATFINHLRLRRRSNARLRYVTLVDSPGMIDSVKPESGRGYDFVGVVRWFAERADLVLVYFDPDKPGTTGETLHVFTEALREIDHKLLIVMNKMDQFRSLRDFARAYGALCWNLGKVIPRKDLPMIYTTFLPLDEPTRSAMALDDFASARDELVEEIMKTPRRRLDNMLTQLTTYAERLRMHARVFDLAVREHRVRCWGYGAALVLLVSMVAAPLGFVSDALPMWAFAAAAVLVFVLGLLGMLRLLARHREGLATQTESLFHAAHAVEMAGPDGHADLFETWAIVSPRAHQSLKRLAMEWPGARPRLSVLDWLLTTEIPRLRAQLLRAASEQVVTKPPPKQQLVAEGSGV